MIQRYKVRGEVSGALYEIEQAGVDVWDIVIPLEDGGLYGFREGLDSVEDCLKAIKRREAMIANGDSVL